MTRELLRIRIHFCWKRPIVDPTRCTNDDHIRRTLGPAACIQVAATIDAQIDGRMGMATGDRIESLGFGRSQGAISHMLCQDTIQEPPTLGVVGDMHVRESEPDAETMQHLEGLLEEGMAGHHAVEFVTVHDE